MRLKIEQLDEMSLEEIMKNYKAITIDLFKREISNIEREDEKYNMNLVENYIYENLGFI